MILQKRRIKAILVLFLLLGILGAWQTAGAGEKININTAGPEQLTQLKGIGPAIAERIVDYREKNGSFTSAEQLLEVRGIGPKTLETIADQVIVSSSG
ncbi:MAG: helix-hairpin-helix domain-containing protein [Desulfosalsimonas sp.]|uniref:ComEA family DNA-binding protein n=1 Tax=Desulfosalsimonas sp. TaxID=3073848 RepID=UPI003970D28A